MNIAKIKILEEMLENSFAIDQYKKFAREFFNKLDIYPASKRTGIWREYGNHIQSYHTIGKYKDSEDNGILIMAVELKRGSSVERARSMQRNFISRVLDENNLDAALVAFYSENESSWRLSFVRLDYTFTDKGLDIELTPAKRYSYLVGKNEPSHTAIKQLLTILEKDTVNPTLDEIEDAFSVEKVTKDFFAQYKEKYLDLKEYLEKNKEFQIESEKLGFKVEKFAEQFSKKLMGQLAFLYFLQKKGWLGVKIVPKFISKQDLSEIYNASDEIDKRILEKVYIRDSDNNYNLNIGLISSKKFSDHEADILSNIFIVNEKYNNKWGSGYKKFIRDVLWRHCSENNRNFFNDYLEPFFYDALNKKRKNQYFKTFNSKIPFLNGGLFEPLEGYHWKDTNFKIPNNFFSNKEEKGRNADGILDIFDTYNFTINENEPLEKDVAVDPEMLGKIFENLLDVKDRKSKGAFYTPREIVHYMCQECLINHLVTEVNVPYEDMKEFILYGEIIKDQDSRRVVVKSHENFHENKTIKQSIFDNIVEIDKALENIKVADPAVGSGAFPLGMLNEIVRARNNITEYVIRKDKEVPFENRFGEKLIREHRSPYKIKTNAIKNSIFAVDIEASAVDITQLRLWLSIIVDQEIEDQVKGPHQLPNLDMNIHVGNSLIDEYEGIKLFDKTILSKRMSEQNHGEDEGPRNIFTQLSILIDHTDEMLKELFDLQDKYFEINDENIKKEIKIKIDKIQKKLIRYKLEKDGNTDGLKRYEESLKNKIKPYFIWELEFARVFKEKGGFDIVIGNPPYIQLQKDGGRLSKQLEPIGYKTFKKSGDIYTLFYEKGLDILAHAGNLGFITSNKWMRNNYGKPLRELFIKNNPIILIDLGSDIFENATVDTNILIIERKEYKNNMRATSLMEVPNKVNFSNLVNQEMIEFNDLTSENWTIEKKEGALLKKKIENICRPLKLWDININYGIKTGKNDVFIIDNVLKERLVLEDKKNQEILKPVLRGRDIGRHKSKWKNLWIIATGYDINIPKNYPSLYTYLSNHENDLKKRYDKGKNWYNLRACSYYEEIEKEKIMYSEIVQSPQFYLDLKGEFYPEASTFIITGKNLKYVYGILNSKAFTYFFKEWYAGGGLGDKGYRYKKSYLQNVPIPKIDDKNIHLVNKIEQLVSEIYFEEQTESKISQIESEIDNIVFSLYNLTKQEILEIENKFKAL